MKYRILFLGYWNLDDGLTKSTIFPHLKCLKGIPDVEYLHFANSQRERFSNKSLNELSNLEIDYSPLYSKNILVNKINKIYDFIHFPKLIKSLIGTHKINLIIARGAPAGSLAYLATKNNGVPYVVESFEPHADYMEATGEWNRYGIRYLFQQYWERQQKKNAKALITVANNYRDCLIEEGVNKDKIFVVPCAVDQNNFYKDIKLRKEIRSKLHISDTATVGINAGKYGGLYLEEKAFEIFKKAFDQVRNFHLLLLTNSDSLWLDKKIKEYKLPLNRIHIKFVPYNEVNMYLNAADFAFALYKTNNVSRYLSPVKIGEYWACGLPVYITPKLGDEMYWIEDKKLGIIIDLHKNNLFNIFSKFSSKQIIKEGIEIRKMGNVIYAYKQILN